MSNFQRLLYLSIFLIIIILFAVIPQHQAIVFQPNNTKATLAYIPIKDVTTFQIRYTHSIHLSDVVESYKITPDQKLQQVELMYEDFAIGMPSNAEAGETFEQINGSYYIKNMKRIFLSFIYESDRLLPIIKRSLTIRNIHYPRVLHLEVL